MWKLCDFWFVRIWIIIRFETKNKRVKYSMNADTLISVQNLSRFYGPLCAVNDISFEEAR